MPVIVKLMEVSRIAADIVIGVLGSEKLFGLLGDAYFPVSNESAYGLDDNEVVYNTVPDLTDYFLMTGIVTEKYRSDESLDGFSGEEVVIYRKGDEYIPLATKVIIYYTENNHQIFKVNKNIVLYGADEDIYQKLLMVPMAACAPPKTTIINPHPFVDPGLDL